MVSITPNPSAYTAFIFIYKNKETDTHLITHACPICFACWIHGTSIPQPCGHDNNLNLQVLRSCSSRVPKLIILEQPTLQQGTSLIGHRVFLCSAICMLCRGWGGEVCIYVMDGQPFSVQPKCSKGNNEDHKQDQVYDRAIVKQARIFTHFFILFGYGKQVPV